MNSRARGPRNQPKRTKHERVYTDGSTDRNGSAQARGGMGVWFGPGDARNLAVPYADSAELYGPPTNQRCELLAIALALEAVDARAVCVVTDSKYAIGCLTDWLPGWRRRGWVNSQGKPVKNRELIERAAAALERSGSVLEHTRGHATGTDPDAVGNRMADELANEGRQRTRSVAAPSAALPRAAADAPLDEEMEAWDAGRLVIGVDEVGRGCLAGPVTVCAVALPVGCALEGLRDSKKLTARRREALDREIRAECLTHHVASRSAAQIDAGGILTMTLDAMREAVQTCHARLDNKNVVVLVDGTVAIPDLGLPQHTMARGDARSRTIAAASIVAKVHRDARMASLPDPGGYAFARHKGYGTKLHYEKLGELGPSAHHRKSFRLAGGYRR